MGLYDEGKWCNDLDPLTFTGERFHRSLRYGENHDEVRLASPKEWGGLGMKVGRPVCAVLFALGRGPVMVYHGQETGEPAAGVEGFGGDDARTSIFDYWSMPEFQKWVNGGRYDGGRLSDEQRALRAWYRELLHSSREPAFETGEFYGLNHANKTTRTSAGSPAKPPAATGCIPSCATTRPAGKRSWWSRTSTAPKPCARSASASPTMQRWLGKQGVEKWSSTG